MKSLAARGANVLRLVSDEDDGLGRGGRSVELARRIRRSGIDGIDLAILPIPLRAMVAARLCTLRKGMIPSSFKPDDVTIAKAAALLRVGKHLVSDARRVLAEATPAECAKVERGEIAASTLAKMLRRRLTPQARLLETQVPLSDRGGNRSRIQAQQMRSEIWRCLREGLEGLSSLPAPRDVVRLMRGLSQIADVIDTRALRAQAWLEEFIDEWTRPGEDDATKK